MILYLFVGDVPGVPPDVKSHGIANLTPYVLGDLRVGHIRECNVFSIVYDDTFSS